MARYRRRRYRRRYRSLGGFIRRAGILPTGYAPYAIRRRPEFLREAAQAIGLNLAKAAVAGGGFFWG